MPEPDLDFTIARLGECRIPSPMSGVRFTGDDERVLYHATLAEMKPWLDRGLEPPSMEAAGARETLFFDPSTVACGIVTCGGLCPGLNDVIRAIVLSLHHHYGVRRILGFRYGYEGLVRRHGHEPLELTADAVGRIHQMGGSILGSSRGPQQPAEMVDRLDELGISVLFAIGGDGTLRGAQAIGEEAARRGRPIAVVGVPKTIDNDVSFVQKTFGFETAVSEARRATHAANAEAEAARNGIGLVKLMGRDSGFIAAYTVLVDGQVNFCLVPEVPFGLEAFLSALARTAEAAGARARRGGGRRGPGPDGEGASARTRRATCATATSASSCGTGSPSTSSGNGTPITLKYIDPSYTIRSVPATPHDSAFCLLLGHSAAHAAMSGRTNLVVSFWNHRFTHVPIRLAVSERKKIDPEGALWSSVLASTGQPRDLR